MATITQNQSQRTNETKQKQGHGNKNEGIAGKTKHANEYGDENEDAYPYIANQTPPISKPTNVGGLSG